MLVIVLVKLKKDLKQGNTNKKNDLEAKKKYKVTIFQAKSEADRNRFGDVMAQSNLVKNYKKDGQESGDYWWAVAKEWW